MNRKIITFEKQRAVKARRLFAKNHLGAGTGIRTQLEGSTVPQDNHYPIPARQDCSLLQGDKTFPGVGSPGDLHHQRDEVLQAVDVVDPAQAR